MATTITAEQVEGRMIDALVEFGAERDQITREASFESLDVDSLDLVELAQIVESDYGVRIDQDDLPKLNTVGKAIDYVVSRSS